MSAQTKTNKRRGRLRRFRRRLTGYLPRRKQQAEQKTDEDEERRSAPGPLLLL